MSRVSIGRRAVTVVLSSMLLMAVTLIPMAGITGAATTNTTCQSVGDASTASTSPAPFRTCWLRIDAPSSVRTGFAFTVQVAVTTDEFKTTTATSDPCGSKAPITLQLVPDYPLTFTNTQTVNANAGIATFSITIPAGPSNAGNYTLIANGPFTDSAATASSTNCSGVNYNGDSQQLMAVDIPADSPIAPCPVDTNCRQASSGTGTQATLIADTGSIWTDVGFQNSIPGGDCSGDQRLDAGGVLRFTLTGSTGTKVIIFAIDQGNVVKGIGLFNVCWSQDSDFASNTGATIHPGQSGNLPTCKGKGDQAPPCVLSRVSGQHNVAFLSVLANPDATGDPFGYGH